MYNGVLLSRTSVIGLPTLSDFLSSRCDTSVFAKKTETSQIMFQQKKKKKSGKSAHFLSNHSKQAHEMLLTSKKLNT